MSSQFWPLEENFFPFPQRKPLLACKSILTFTSNIAGRSLLGIRKAELGIRNSSPELWFSLLRDQCGCAITIPPITCADLTVLQLSKCLLLMVALPFALECLFVTPRKPLMLLESLFSCTRCFEDHDPTVTHQIPLGICKIPVLLPLRSIWCS